MALPSSEAIASRVAFRENEQSWTKGRGAPGRAPQHLGKKAKTAQRTNLLINMGVPCRPIGVSTLELILDDARSTIARQEREEGVAPPQRASFRTGKFYQGPPRLPHSHGGLYVPLSNKGWVHRREVPKQTGFSHTGSPPRSSAPLWARVSTPEIAFRQRPDSAPAGIPLETLNGGASRITLLPEPTFQSAATSPAHSRPVTRSATDSGRHQPSTVNVARPSTSHGALQSSTSGSGRGGGRGGAGAGAGASRANSNASPSRRPGSSPDGALVSVASAPSLNGPRPSRRDKVDRDILAVLKPYKQWDHAGRQKKMHPLYVF
jgi:hypothetical protein